MMSKKSLNVEISHAKHAGNSAMGIRLWRWVREETDAKALVHLFYEIRGM